MAHSTSPEFLILCGAVLFQAGDQEQGRALMERVRDLEPANLAWATDRGMALFLLGDVEWAKRELEEVVRDPDASAAAYNRLAMARLALIDVEGAETALRESLLRDPKHPALYSNLGGMLIRQEKAEQALAAYEHALRLKPDLSQAQAGRDAALMLLDRSGEVIERLEAELEDSPDSVELRRRLARLLIMDGRVEEAIDRLREAINADERDLGPRLELAELQSRQGRYPAAASELEAALEKEPDNLAALNQLARCQVEMRRLGAARETMAKAFAASEEAPVNLITRAHIHSADEDHDAAQKDLKRALEKYPGSGEAWSLLGHSQMWAGDLDEAVKSFERAAELQPGALASLVEARAIPDDPKVIERMERFARFRLMPAEARASMAYALVKVFEKHNDHAKAFEFAKLANGLTREGIKHDAQRHSTYVDRLIRVYTPALFERTSGMGNESQRPVFVVGMPRSGTTLTEQILASHPRVFGAGELGLIPAVIRRMPKVVRAKAPYPGCMARFGKRTAEHAALYYLKHVAAMDADAMRTVDKLPHNFLHLGLIAILFPNARIIHVMRDPRDVAISNYFTNFKHKRGGMSYAFDLAEIGHMINDHDRIMAHWREVLPVPILDLKYEDLVDDQAAATRRLLEFVGLEWDDSVIDFHKTERAVRTASVWQVRQPMYKTSTERWRRYEDSLGPLNEVLAQSTLA